MFHVIYDITYNIIYDITYDIIYDVLLCAGLCGVTGALPEQLPSVVCTSSTLLQLYLVSRQGVHVQCFHKEVSLMYFSTFKPIGLTPDSIMQQAGVPMLYDSASNQHLPCLYICPVANVLGRAPRAPTVTPRFHTASRTMLALEAPPPTLSGTRATAAGCTK